MTTGNNEPITIGTIGNYYGGLAVKSEGDKFFWSIENFDGYDWVEIPENLYRTLLDYEETR